jgi:chromosome partitioning protein
MRGPTGAPEARRITATIQKGGVGKSTINALIAMTAARYFGLTTLLVDLDPQGDATDHALQWAKEPEFCVSDVLRRRIPLAEALLPVPSISEGLWLLPATGRLDQFRDDVTNPPMAIAAIAETLRTSIPEGIELVVFDTPPSGDVMMRSALAVCHHFFVLMEADRACLKGVNKVLGTARDAARRWNPELGFGGIIVNKERETTSLQATVVEALLARHGDDVIRPRVPLRAHIADAVALGEMPRERENVALIRALTEEVLRRAGALPVVPA